MNGNDGLRRLLTHGFFPWEVPQCFLTKPYGEAVAADDADIPTEMTSFKARQSRPLARHNLARVGQLRRPLSVPHPERFFALCREIAREWHSLSEAMERSTLSVSKPTLTVDDDADRAIATVNGPADYPELRAQYRRNARYVAYADVQRCYASIYTHAIAWAVEGKIEAKGNRGWDRVGNRLDGLSRKLQDDQSLGIPIGPDTSQILAELVLSAVDFDFQETMKSPIQGFRAVDDYELAFKSRSDAEVALAKLQSALLKYELQLNETKTRIVGLPDALKDSWPQQLKNVRIREGHGQTDAFVTLFSLAFELAGDYPNKSVLRYAISIANGTDIENDSWPVYQNILLQCAASEPGTLRYVTAELARARSVGLGIDDEGVRELCSHLISMHAPLGHGSEVAWALWLAIVLEVALPARDLDVLVCMDDPFVPVLALYAEEQGQIVNGSLNKSRWENIANDSGLDGSYWLLAYEGACKGWLGQDSEEKVDGHGMFRWLRENEVSFFDGRASVLGLNRWSRTLPYGEAVDSGTETSAYGPDVPL